ncbi:MAG: ABC transporter permease [Mycoplasmatales bacterium]
MKNKKIIGLLVCIMFFLIYQFNQIGLLYILVNPIESKYDIGQKFDGYLVEASERYLDIMQQLNNKTDYCIIFENPMSSKGVYTPECDEKSRIFKSETAKFDLEDTKEANTSYFDSIYEEVEGTKELRNIENFSSEELFGYNIIFIPKDKDIVNFFPEDFEYIPIKDPEFLFSMWDGYYVYDFMKLQVVTIGVISLLSLIYILYEYIQKRKKEYAVYQLLGISDKEIMKKAFWQYFFILTMSYLIAAGLYYLIVFLNGKLFYLSLYFEYFSFTYTIITYLIMILSIVPLALILFCIYEFTTIEKRLKWEN